MSEAAQSQRCRHLSSYEIKKLIAEEVKANLRTLTALCSHVGWGNVTNALIFAQANLDAVVKQERTAQSTHTQIDVVVPKREIASANVVSLSHAKKCPQRQTALK